MGELLSAKLFSTSVRPRKCVFLLIFSRQHIVQQCDYVLYKIVYIRVPSYLYMHSVKFDELKYQQLFSLNDRLQRRVKGSTVLYDPDPLIFEILFCNMGTKSKTHLCRRVHGVNHTVTSSVIY